MFMSTSENKSKITLKPFSPEHLFWLVMLIDILVMFIYVWVSKGEVLSRIGYSESFFIDFWNHANRLLFYDKIYGTTDPDAIFPPLAYCFIMLFVHPLKYKLGTADDISEIATSGYGVLMLIIFIGIFCCLFTQQVNSYYKAESKVMKGFAPVLFMLSFPFWYFAFERGNMTIYAMLFLWFSLANYKSEDPRIRELAMLSLAVSASFKLYPALFGFLWIREKRYKDTVRLVIYGLAAFFVPFFILNRGSVIDYWITFQKYISKGIIYPPSILGNTTKVFGAQGLAIGYAIEFVWVIWLAVVIFTRQTDWKTITLLMSTQTIMIPEAYMYTYVYIAIAVVMFLNETREAYRTIDYIYAFFFATTFTAIPLTSATVALQFEMYTSWVIVLLLISADVMVELVKKVRH